MKELIALLEKIPANVFILISAVTNILGDYFAKCWSQTHKTSDIGFSMIFFLAASIFFIPSLLKSTLVISALLWTVFTLTGFIFLGLVVFKETISPYQVAGLVLSVIAIILLNIPSK